MLSETTPNLAWSTPFRPLGQVTFPSWVPPTPPGATETHPGPTACPCNAGASWCPFSLFFSCLKLKYKLKKLTLGAALLEKDAGLKAVDHASQSLLPGGAGSFGKKLHE